jgi:3-hydroxyisobutyrate dehydrogenase
VTRVGFVGAGRMGAPMVRRLAESGHEIRVLCRTAEKRLTIGELGGRGVTDLQQIGDGAEVVIVCVFTDDQVRQVCLDGGLLSAMPRGSTLVIHTTGSPCTAEAIAAEYPDIEVVDAPVSGGPHNIAAGAVTLFVGGTDDAVARVRPVLASYGDPILHAGPLGAGQAVKLTNNTLFAAQIGLLREAITLGAALGVDEAKLLDAITHGSGGSRAGGFIATRGSVKAFVDDTAEFIEKDVAVVRAIAAEVGTDLGILDDVINVGIRP